MAAIDRLGELVCAFREARLLSQDALASRISPKTNRSAVAHLEQGLRLPPVQTLRGICSYLEIPEALWLPFQSAATDGVARPSPISMVAIAGVMGSGKTTLARRLAATMGLRYVAESSIGVSFLDDLETDASRWAFDAQLAFLCQKATAILNAIERGSGIIVDRSLFEDVEIFARHFLENGHIDERSFRVYETLAQHFLEAIPSPDAIIYCQCGANTALRRISRRARGDRAGHSPGHVRGILQRYNRWIAGYSSSTLFAVDSTRVDFREEKTILTIAHELDQFFAEPAKPTEQLSLFTTHERLVRPRKPAKPILKLVKRTGRPPRATMLTVPPPVYPYPSAYIAAPFTSKAKTRRSSGRSTLFPLTQPEGQIHRGSYRSGLLRISATLKAMGIHSILPHRDVNRWGRITLTPAEVVSACTSHVSACDIFVGILGLSHGSHYELGVARGQGKPAIVIHCPEVAESFIATGVLEGPGLHVIACKTLREAADALRSERVQGFLRTHLPGFRELQDKGPELTTT